MFLHQASFRHAKHVQSVMRRPFSATIATSKALKKLRTPEQRRQLEKTISLQNVARLMNRKLTVQKAPTTFNEPLPALDPYSKKKYSDQIERVLAGVRRRNPRAELEKKRMPPHVLLVFNPRWFRRLGEVKSETQQFPTPASPTVEVCFVGRSNVGKSSLLNALAGGYRAEVADRPGVTRTINFYSCSQYLHLIDLPGYGFAFAKEEEKQQWVGMLKKFVCERKTLKRVFVLIDARHGLKMLDLDFLQFLNQNKISNQIVITKTDLVQTQDLVEQMHKIKQEIMRFSRTHNNMLLASTKSTSGLYEIKRVIVGLVPNMSKILAEHKRKEEEAKSNAMALNPDGNGKNEGKL